MKSELKSLSQTDRVSKFCTDAGFISVVEIEHYFMTKDNGEQFYAKACREDTLPKVTDHHNQKDGSRETQKLDPCWKLRPVAYMVNTELKLESGL